MDIFSRQLIQNKLKNAKIFIADDQQINITLLSRILKLNGYNNVLATTDSRKVVDIFMQQDIDLLILDLEMPHTHGMDIIESLNQIEENNFLPILVITAATDEKTCYQALGKGAKDFITKPFRSEEVLLRIKNILEVSLLYKYLRDQNESLEKKVIDRTKELQDTRLEVIRRLGLAAEYRDNETGMHIIRMSKYSELLAMAAGLNDYDVDMILNASPMHDVGKIGISDNILLKPGSLTDTEWATMKSHTTIGAEILGKSEQPLLVSARIIALNHHERWDGNGYPHGIAGEQIPIFARIVSIADVFDALTSVRTYKKAWTEKDAYEEIVNQAGKQFDPVLIKHFKDIFPDILEIKKLYS